jgi:diadenosine tetraphosphate (Ap4A) HIT family hydrolase
VKLNYDLLGNSLPHLHTHVIPRYADDPRPGWPFPFPEEEPPRHNEADFRADVEALRALLA